MNNLDQQYTDLLQDILDTGTIKKDRTGTGTVSVFGRTIRHKMSEGFPLLTTKKLHFSGIATELIWFLRGDTNIKFLVDNGCNIWNGDAYKRFLTEAESIKKGYEDGDMLGSQPHIEAMFSNSDELIILKQDEFVEKIKTNQEFADEWGGLGPIYGRQWRNWKYGESKSNMGSIPYYDNIDQIRNLLRDLKKNPDSRRLMVNAWNVAEIDSMVLPPCHYGFQVYTRELNLESRMNLWFNNHKPNRDVCDYVDEMSDALKHKELSDRGVPTRTISLSWNQRSVDTFLGLPYNIASYGLLLEILANLSNMVPDELIGYLGDTHLYLNHLEQAKEQISRQPHPLPHLNINTEFWLTESGSCGEGPLSSSGFLEGLNQDSFCRCLLEDDIQLSNYQSHPKIVAPLSN